MNIHDYVDSQAPDGAALCPRDARACRGRAWT